MTLDISHARSRARGIAGNASPVVPQSVKGRIRRIKWAMLWLCLATYYLLPFLRWDRGAGAPDQAVLLDFEHGRLYAFFVEIWPQDLYYITGLLVLAAAILILANAVAGRIWCGFACPQTVWTDLFMTVERWIEGDRRERLKKIGAPLSARRALEIGAQTCRLDRDRDRHRRRARFLLYRCADAPAAVRARRGFAVRLGLGFDLRRDDLRSRGICTRAGLHLHVPVAAAAGRDLGP
ncbi:MAG: 4Fe-4S binding protein [Rhodoblastus sp.]